MPKPLLRYSLVALSVPISILLHIAFWRLLILCGISEVAADLIGFFCWVMTTAIVAYGASHSFPEL